jgi:hypothetical protein
MDKALREGYSSSATRGRGSITNFLSLHSLSVERSSRVRRIYVSSPMLEDIEVEVYIIDGALII